jgi:hypothetical protein
VNVVALTLRAVQLARGFGLTVTFEPGWETRGNGYAGNYVGVLVHHTGTPSSLANPFPTRRVLRDGRPDLTGPLCNSAVPADGSVHVMAAQAANHAGASGGRSMGPLPKTSLFNPRVWGHEIDYAGSVLMLPGQYRTAALWSHCLLLALVEYGQIPTFDSQRVRLHAETSITGKWDAGDGPSHTIDAAAFRAAVANPEDDMTPQELLDYKITRQGSVLGGTTSLRAMLANWDQSIEREATRDKALAAAVAALSDDPTLDRVAIGEIFDVVVKAHTPTAAQNAEAQRPFLEDLVRSTVPAEQADAIVDELVSRLANPTEGN